MRQIEIESIDMSKPRVRYKGQVQDKCALSGLIHDVALMAGNSVYPMWSDIYWDSARYDELRDYLTKWIEKYKSKYNSNYV